MIKYFAAFLLFVSLSCSEKNEAEKQSKNTDIVVQDSIVQEPELDTIPEIEISDTSLVNIQDFSDLFVVDMVYSDENNFFEKKFYPCNKCYLRYESIKALINAASDFRKLGYKIKLFDCFRPFSVQVEMWKTLPDTRYVANPERGGSIHNKGAAVDLTLVDVNENDLDMGTEFDHFGPESAHSYSKLDSTCIQNRKILKSVMEQNGFKALETEWWHYTFVSDNKYKNADLDFDCQ